MKLPVCCLAALFLTAGVRAGTVIYTDSTHPVTGNPGPEVTVVLLDAPDRLQAQLFGPLPADPAQAEQQARTVIGSPDFQRRQQDLAGAYAGLTRAWSLGLEKYPAVVFDDKWVVYGTSDVDVATQKLNVWKEKAQ
ncbi:TPA: TIGR03757 family integrating conjugative element protein [Klebsiella pneumoniae]|jgi:integrating conjugative element protein (TIGR03757 family)|uniref:TIGR03757 family integrating conjugative element protein n=2 Tax=Enterobacter cloacae TaxID=550 RepID=A0A0H3CEI8_ENTCC|nr:MULTISPECIES: TIGR03757 family integrating conjugative element protein [Enterobacteriaceae]AUU88919.1 TIGR03757 family integrating conjugative element protein [Enterobacteriaceae bacterium ENNIH3]AUV05790.1 TIGR03757 family integrating conjugative element protein [Enterobacteriaceae bacterium ENNIH2]ELD7981839.1 TIGR03757 family integrating conjugative element protein [Enterobacter hormaechei]MDU4295322.1 TIGR03757 family integrating conjugative element protein [Enterobacter asburiae]HAT749